jgi:type IV pilus assembly protein PilW
MSKNSGFSLIELLVAMAIASIVMAAIFLAYQVQVTGKISQENTLDMNQGTRAGLEQMASDIRIAGCDPTGNAAAGFKTATSTALEITMDISGGGNTGNESDGVIGQPGEDVRYTLTAGNIMRERVGTDAAGGFPLVSNVDALNLVYLDNNNAPTVDLTAIKSVQVSIVVHSTKRGMTPSYTNNNSYFNQQGAQILAPQNDTLRRIELSTTVQCRNMGG